MEAAYAISNMLAPSARLINLVAIMTGFYAVGPAPVVVVVAKAASGTTPPGRRNASPTGMAPHIMVTAAATFRIPKP